MGPARQLRKRLKPLRNRIRSYLPARLVQRSVPLEPEDRELKRRRHHVLVDLITEHCPASGVVIGEIGTHAGYNAYHLLKYCSRQIARFYAIDLQRPDPDFDFITDLERAELIIGSSDECAKRFDDEFFDLVFIDADHSEDAVRIDLRAWLPKVKTGGVISGHDYGSHNHPGVKTAVDAHFRDHSHPVRLEANKVWWTFK